jgi:hypothetical protein
VVVRHGGGFLHGSAQKGEFYRLGYTQEGAFFASGGGPIICYSEVRNSTQFETIEVPVDKK